MLELTREGPVFLLRLDHGENRFDPEMLAAFGEALDEVARAAAPAALVTTGTGKFFSNGLDVEYMGRLVSADVGAYVRSVLELMVRVLTLPMTTVAAVNGHAFGAGAQLVSAHDFQVMRADRGYYCMPEVDMRVPLHPAMTALLQARLPARTAHRVIATGHRFGGEEAAVVQIVDRAVPEAEVVPTAIAMAAELAAKADPAMGVLKRGMYGPVLDALDRPVPGLDGGVTSPAGRGARS
jgi:enoyl-CoA hydratase/carnithine racemase